MRENIDTSDTNKDDLLHWGQRMFDALERELVDKLEEKELKQYHEAAKGFNMEATVAFIQDDTGVSNVEACQEALLRIIQAHFKNRLARAKITAMSGIVRECLIKLLRYGIDSQEVAEESSISEEQQQLVIDYLASHDCVHIEPPLMYHDIMIAHPELRPYADGMMFFEKDPGQFLEVGTHNGISFVIFPAGKYSHAVFQYLLTEHLITRKIIYDMESTNQEEYEIEQEQSKDNYKPAWIIEYVSKMGLQLLQVWVRDYVESSHIDCVEKALVHRLLVVHDEMKAVYRGLVKSEKVQIEIAMSCTRAAYLLAMSKRCCDKWLDLPFSRTSSGQKTVITGRQVLGDIGDMLADLPERIRGIFTPENSLKIAEIFMNLPARPESAAAARQVLEEAMNSVLSIFMGSEFDFQIKLCAEEGVLRILRVDLEG